MGEMGRQEMGELRGRRWTALGETYLLLLSTLPLFSTARRTHASAVLAIDFSLCVQQKLAFVKMVAQTEMSLTNQASLDLSYTIFYAQASNSIGT